MATDPTIDANSVHDVQVARLDADMFNADDIDGVTEGLVGSGNLNYLVLQSSQTNEAARNVNPFEYQASDFNPDGPLSPMGTGQIGELSDSRAINPSDFTNNDDSARGFLNTLTNNSDNHFSENNNDNFNNVNTISATHNSNFASESSITNNRYHGDDGLNGDDGLGGDDGAGLNGGDGNNGTSGTSGTSGINGGNGNNGNDGRDEVSPDLPPDTPVHSHIGVNVISDLLNVGVNLPIDAIGNLVGGVNVDVDAILGDILNTDDGLLPHPGLILDGIIGDNHIINDLNIGPLLGGAENLVDGAINALNPVLSSALPFVPNLLGTVNGLVNGLNGDSGIFITTGLGLPGLGGGAGVGNLDLHVPTALLDGIIGTTNLHLDVASNLSNILSGDFTLPPIDIGLLSTGDILNGIDTGLTTGNLIPSTLNAVQDIVGNLTEGGDILGNIIPNITDVPGNLADTLGQVGAPVADILGDIGSGNIFGTPDLSSLTDYVGDLNLNNIVESLTDGLLGGDTLPGGDLLAPVTDVVESLLGGGLPSGGDFPGGDILAPVTDVVADLLGGDVLPGGGDIFAPVTDVVGDLLGGGLPDLGNIPDTVTDIAGDLLGGGGGLPGGDIPGFNILEPVVETVTDLLGGGVPNPTDLADALSGLPGDVQDLAGGIASGDLLHDLLGGNGAGNGGQGADTDLNIDTGLTIGDTALNSIDVNATLDTVENIVGDIDINVDANIGDTINHVLSGDIDGAVDHVLDTLGNALTIDVSLLNPEPDQNAGLGLGIGDGDGLNGILSDTAGALNSWPEATVGGLLDTVNDTLSGAGGGLPVTLPEPTGLITEGLNLISDAGHTSGGALGGLFGGHHGGGLFG